MAVISIAQGATGEQTNDNGTVENTADFLSEKWLGSATSAVASERVV